MNLNTCGCCGGTFASDELRPSWNRNHTRIISMCEMCLEDAHNSGV